MEQLFQQNLWLDELLQGFTGLDTGQVFMWCVGALFIWLAVKKQYEPFLLIPMGAGILMANIPQSAAIKDIPGAEGFLVLLYNGGVANGFLPVLLFISLGAMCDFSALLRQPRYLLIGAAAQAGIFLIPLLAVVTGFTFPQAAVIGLLGSANGPLTIFAAGQFAAKLMGPVALVTWLYLALLPLLQRPVLRLLTSETERRLPMTTEAELLLPRSLRVTFPVVALLLTGILVPSSAAVMGALLFGNLLRESGVTQRLADSVQGRLADLATLFLGLAVGGTMTAKLFLTWAVSPIFVLGAFAIFLDTAAGVLFIKLLNCFSVRKINPLLGACGVAPFPMAARTAVQAAWKEDPRNCLLEQALGINAAGRIASVVAGALVLALVPALSK